MQCDEAGSSIQGNILMLTIVVIMGSVLLFLVMGLFSLDLFHDSLAPPIIKIIGINHNGAKFESQVVIRSFSPDELDNNLLMARLKVNGDYLLAHIYTLHGYDFIPTRHFGVKNIGGSGCSGQFFSPGETIVIDLKNGYIHPGDIIELRIYQKSDSRNYLPPGNLLDEDYMEEYEAEYIFSQMKDYRIFSQAWYTA